MTLRCNKLIFQVAKNDRPFADAIIAREVRWTDIGFDEAAAIADIEGLLYASRQIRAIPKFTSLQVLTFNPEIYLRVYVEDRAVIRPQPWLET